MDYCIFDGILFLVNKFYLFIYIDKNVGFMVSGLYQLLKQLHYILRFLDDFVIHVRKKVMVFIKSLIYSDDNWRHTRKLLFQII